MCSWAAENRSRLQQRGSPLEFDLHKIHFISMITRHDPPDQLEALGYLRRLSASLYASNDQEIYRMITSLLFLPVEKLRSSPYSDLLDPTLIRKSKLELAREYCASMGLSRSVPLQTVGTIGAGGALTRIEKSRKVMRENKSEWSQVDELPVNSFFFTLYHNLQARNRLKYHSFLNIGIILYLRAWFRKSRRLKPIHQC